MQVPSRPDEAGLPDKFGYWRTGQREAVSLCLNSPERIISICAPTGFGKSAVAVAAAYLSRKSTLVVTWTKGLMAQYEAEFPGMTALMGRDNYRCQMREDFSCDEGYPARCPHKGSIQCPYSRAEMAMATSRLGVTNYAKWTSGGRVSTALGHFEQVVFDESHHMPEAICNAMQVELRAREIEEMLGLQFPRGMDTDDMQAWRTWTQAALPTVQAAVLAALDKITSSGDPKPSWVRHYNHMRNMMRKMTTLSTARPSGWVVDELRDRSKTAIGYQFEPIWPGKYGESTLLLGVPRVICISATLRPKTLTLCGISQEAYRFEEFPSDFDPARCPIYYVPTMRIDAKQLDFTALFARLDQTMARRRDRKGIIHTVSFDRQEDILRHSRFRESMIINKRGSPTTETVTRFKSAAPGTILVTPSVGEGYDFPDDECRWQIMAKIPFEPPSKIVKAREAEDKEYRSYQAMQQMIQSFGRSTRSRLDWSECFIFDKHLDWFWGKHKHLAPAWFHNFFITSHVVPHPLQPDGEE